MTRGTIVFTLWNEHDQKWYLYKSCEFNGDMAPDMYCGKTLLDKFDKIFFNKKNHSHKAVKIQKIVLDMVKLFGYENFEHVSFLDCFHCYPLDSILVNVSTKENLRKYFNYSDYVYIVNASSHKFPISIEDGTHRIVHLNKNQVYVFNYDEFIGTYDGNFHSDKFDLMQN